MAAEPKLTHTATMILQAIDTGYVYGFSVMEVTGLPSGTVYPAMRRLERDDLIRSSWEKQKIADDEQRPARKYYKLTRAGKLRLQASQKRYPLLGRIDSRPGRSSIMTLHLAILRIVSLIVPRPERAEWLAEWRSELWYVRAARHREATAFCLGAFPDALWLRRNNRTAGARSIPSQSRCDACVLGGSRGSEFLLRDCTGGERVRILPQLLMVLIALLVLPVP